MRLQRGIAARAVRATVVALSLLPAVGGSSCSQVMVSNNCHQIIASDINVVGEAVASSVDVSIADGEACSLMTGFEIVAFNDQDGVSGFDADGGDIPVRTFAGNPPVTDHLHIAQWSNVADNGGVTATSWQATITGDDGVSHTYSGSFH